MQYLGGIRGGGTITCDGEMFARADYDFDGFLLKPGQATGSGEIRTSPETLQKIFGRKDLQLLTDDGRIFNLRFSEKNMPSASNAAHVDITGELPTGSRHWCL